MTQRLVSVPLNAFLPAVTAAACGLKGLSKTFCQEPPADAKAPRHPAPLKGFGSGDIPSRSNNLASFGLTDIPSKAYKDHFAAAHDESAANAAQRRAENGSIEHDRQLRRRLANHLMTKIGYTKAELDFLGDDVLRMQGVSSPFPLAKLCESEVVVDLGSGFGPDAFLAASKVGPTGSVTGINISEGEVETANARASERGLDRQNCQFVVADMEATPVKGASADVVISNGGFCLCPNKQAAFREVHRILRPGGRIAISCTVLRKPLPALEGKRWPPCMEVFMPRSEIEDVLQKIGFEAIYVDETSSKMDVWEFGDSDVDSVANGLTGSEAASPAAEAQMCSHARKAAERRAKQDVETYLTRDRETGVHWGNPAFEHIQDFDMNELCARVIIYAEKLR